MQDPWFNLRQFTQARIAQGRVGCAIPTSAHLDFQLAQAMARDAVHQAWDIENFAESIAHQGLQSLKLSTQVSNRVEYLQKPDLGRCLNQKSIDLLSSLPRQSIDVTVIVSNGLSSMAVHNHGLTLLMTAIETYKMSGFNLSPICLVPNARVALMDEIGERLKARLAVIILGERPGLSAADSLGIYMTYAPKHGNTDADRNCLSNIRPPEGMSYSTAAAKLLYLTQQALERGLSGVELKDDMPSHILDSANKI